MRESTKQEIAELVQDAIESADIKISVPEYTRELELENQGLRKSLEHAMSGQDELVPTRAFSYGGQGLRIIALNHAVALACDGYGSSVVEDAKEFLVFLKGEEVEEEKPTTVDLPERES